MKNNNYEQLFTELTPDLAEQVRGGALYYMQDDKDNIWAYNQSSVEGCNFYHNSYPSLEIEKALTHAYQNGAFLLLDQPLYVGWIRSGSGQRQAVVEGGTPFKYEELLELSQEYFSYEQWVKGVCSKS